MKPGIKIIAVILAHAIFVNFSCVKSGEPAHQVVAYVSLDEMFSRPILDAFTEETGIAVYAVYDTEAAKTTGLVTRLLAERGRPRADVFWNNEVVQTIMLARDGILEKYVSPTAAGVPAQFKDPQGFWTGLAARSRVIIYNTKLVSTPPRSVQDLLRPDWRGKACIANPLFGTTASHAAALFAVNDDQAKAFFNKLKENEIAIVAGNAVVRDMVGRGDYAWGITDTDDAHGGTLDGLPIEWLFPDQEGQGTLLLPNTVALLKGAPHAEDARKLIDYLLSPKVQEKLAQSRSLQIPLHKDAAQQAGLPNPNDIRVMAVSYDAMADAFPIAAEWLRVNLIN